MRMYKLHIDGMSPVIHQELKDVLDDIGIFCENNSLMDNASVQIVDMTEDEYHSLPEFMGH